MSPTESGSAYFTEKPGVEVADDVTVDDGEVVEVDLLDEEVAETEVGVVLDDVDIGEDDSVKGESDDDDGTEVDLAVVTDETGVLMRLNTLRRDPPPQYCSLSP